MSIADKLSRLAQTKADIKAAIIAKGQEITDDPFQDYADKIAAIETGGGSIEIANRGLFTGAIYPVTFKGNTNTYENEWEYKSLYDITITGLGNVATITGNGTKEVKVAFDVTGSTDSITPFVITLERNDEEYNFDGRYFYYGAEVEDGNCLAVCTKIAPAIGVTGDFADNFAFVESSSYPLFSVDTTAWNTFYSHQVVSFIFAKKAESIGNYFLSYCYSFNQPLTIPDGMESIGDYFLSSCYSFNQPLTIPDNMESIGDYFLSSCYSFNQPLTIPDGMESIGDYFLSYCYSFNQPLTIPDGMESIGDYFLSYCYSFNQPLTIPDGIKSIGSYFLRSCYSFNQPLTIPDGIKSIGNYFLSYCYSFNQPLTIPDGMESIGNYFLSSCYSFNQPLTIPDNMESIGSSFLGYCYSFNQPLTIPDGMESIGSYFLSSCYSFNQPLTIPDNMESIGSSFLRYCYSFTLLEYNASVYPIDTNSLSQDIDTKTSANGTGIKIIGTNAATLKAKLPDRTAFPYRKLV